MIDYKKYPPNWKTEIRPRILDRAKDCCEICGVPDRAYIARNKKDPAKYIICEPGDIENLTGFHHMVFTNTYRKPIKVILTIAHLDHDPENWDVKDDRLKALCQRCHLNMDREERKKL